MEFFSRLLSASLVAEGDLWKFYKGDSLSLVRALPQRGARFVLTDPPYSSGGLYRGDRALSTDQKYGCAGEAFEGDAKDQLAFQEWTRAWMSEARRVLINGGYLFSFCDWRQLVPTINALQGAGLIFRGVMPWDKINSRVAHNGFFRNQCEYVVWGSRGNLEKHPNGPFPGSCRQSGVHHTKRNHPCAKPVEVMEWLLSPSQPGDLVVDPFAGSGTVGVAAIKLGLRYVGMELSDHYAETAIARLRDASNSEGVCRGDSPGLFAESGGSSGRLL